MSGKKGKFLRNRIRYEKVRDASTFFDQELAERVIQQAVIKDKAAITAWFLDSADNADHPSEYIGHHEIPIGISISYQNLDVVVPKYDAVARLRKAADCRIFILTAYPE